MSKKTNNAVSLERLKEALSLDKDSYILSWKKDIKNPKNAKNVGKPAGVSVSGYKQICIDGVKYKAHRLIWFWVYGRWPEKDIDHIDGDGMNNNPLNLREANPNQNAWNAKIQSNNASGLKGISYSSERDNYEAKICINGKKIHLGRFRDPNDAHAAYMKAARKHFGEFARSA